MGRIFHRACVVLTAAVLLAVWPVRAAGQRAEELMVQLRHPRPMIRERAAYALRLLGPKAAVAVPALLATAKSDRNPRVVSKALWAAASISPTSPQVVDALVYTMKSNKEPQNRAAAAQRLWADAMSRWKDKDKKRFAPKIVPAITHALADADPAVRLNACMCAAKLGSYASGAVSALKQALRHKEADVREKAAVALGAIGPKAKSALPALKRAAMDKDAGVKARAGAAIRQIEGVKEKK